jgi:hypothetical protein
MQLPEKCASKHLPSGVPIHARTEFGVRALLGVARVLAAPARDGLAVGLYPVVTFQCSSTTLYQVSDHIQELFF